MSDPDLESLPMSWQWSTLSEIAAIKGGLTKGKKRKETDQLYTVPYLRVANVQRGFLDLREIRYIQATETELSQLKLVSGDVLFTEGGDRDKLGRGWIWSEEIEECIHQNHVFRARLYLQELPPKLISLYSNSFGQRYFLGAGKQTTNLASINLTKLSNLPIPLPPLNEQRRIVAKIEALTTHSRKAREALDAIPALLDQFRQSVLAAAFRGDLTADWRVQNPDVEPAEKLLERVCGKRIVQYEEECAVAISLNLKKPKKPSYFSFDLDQEVEYSQELPKNWVIAPVGLLCDCIVPGRDKPKSFTGEIPWITIPDLVLDEIYKSQQGVGLTKQEISEVKARIIPVGSVIMSCVGRFGISSIARQPIVVNQQLHAFLKSDLLEPRYLMYQIRSLASYMDGLATSTTVAYLNKSNCNNLPINLPPVEEQKLIVSRLDKAWDVISTLESRYLGFAEKVWSTAQKSHRLPPGCWPSYGGQG